MWRPKWGNLSIRLNIGVFNGDSGSRQPRIRPLSTIPQVEMEEVVVPEFENDGRVRGGECEKHYES